MTIHTIYRPFLTHFRRKRLQLLTKTLSVNSGTKILDIGGNTFFWNLLVPGLGSEMPQITILNIDGEPKNLPSYIRWVRGDACRLPFTNGRFDLAFCNSVIEHMGSLDTQVVLASEVRRVAKHYWVQTPDPRFFIEPHYVTPFVHWLPKPAQRALLRNCTMWGLLTRPLRKDIEQILAELRLVRPSEFRCLFPDAEIILERFAGLPKSMIAVRK